MSETESVLQADEMLVPINNSLRLIQKRQGLTFGTDAYLLYAYMRRQKNACAADLGCGTGVISLLCASVRKFSRIYAIEVQGSFAALTERNAALNGLHDLIHPVCADVRTLTENDLKGTVDVVFSNPPYLKTNAGKENAYTEKQLARHEENGSIVDFCKAADRILKYGGLFYVVYPPDRMADLCAALRDNHLAPKRMTLVYPTENHAPCLLLLEAKKGAAGGTFVTKPLILQQTDTDGKQSDTADNLYIYEHGEFHDDYQHP